MGFYEQKLHWDGFPYEWMATSQAMQIMQSD
eukprot:COSAG01_NODE_834_length_13230_cov_18.826746_13_plen_31_part_00